MSPLEILFPSSGSSVSDIAIGPCWLLANILLIAACWIWARRLFPRDLPMETIGHAIVLGWACIVVVATLLGFAECLSGPMLLLAVALVCLAALASHRFSHSSCPPQPFRLGRVELFWSLVWSSLGAFWIGYVSIEVLFKFPGDWDTLTYHLPMVDHWLESQTLYTPDAGRWSNPGNNELLALWAVGPFSGDFLASLNNLPAMVLLACATVGLMRHLGLSVSLAYLMGLAAVCHHVGFKQLVDGENDVAVAATFFAVLSYAFRYAERPGFAILLLGTLSLGLLTGVKYYALGYAALALGAWMLLTAPHGPRASLRVLLIGGAGCLALGGYWYLRNWVFTGSPLYPKEFFKQPDVLTTLYPEVAFTSFFGNGRPELLRLYVEAIWKMTGPCQLAGFVLAPVSLLWLTATGGWQLYRRRGATHARARLVFAGILVGTGVLLGITPFAVEDDPGTLNQMHWHYCPVRYGLCYLNTAMLAAALLLEDVLAWLRSFVFSMPGRASRSARYLSWVSVPLFLLILAGAVLFQIGHGDDRNVSEQFDALLLGGNLLLGGITFVLLTLEWPWLRRWLVLCLLVAAFPAWGWACSRLAENWHQGFAAHYDRLFGGIGFSYLERMQPKGTICVLDHRDYPFFGSRRQFRVFQPVYVPSPEWLLQQIRKRRVSIVAARQRWPAAGWNNFRGFEKCLAQHPSSFRRVGEISGVVFYQVVDLPRNVGRSGTNGRE